MRSEERKREGGEGAPRLGSGTRGSGEREQRRYYSTRDTVGSPVCGTEGVLATGLNDGCVVGPDNPVASTPSVPDKPRTAYLVE